MVYAFLPSLLALWMTSLSFHLEAAPLGDLFRRVNASVVVIRTEETVGGEQSDISISGIGSGVLISEDGKVITAAHVVQAADAVEVQFLDGAVVWAEVIASVLPADVALLQLKQIPPGAVAAKLGDSDRVDVGDEVFIVGAPYGIGHTMTVGHISARHAPNTIIEDLALGEFFQTDAAINQGNSGGPMFNMQGEVIGIVSHILSQSGGFEGLGFAVTANMARDMLLRQPSFWSGFEGFLLYGRMAEIFNVPQSAGILVQRVAKHSPAARLGIRGGIIVAEIGGESLVLGGDIILEAIGVQVTKEESYTMIREHASKLTRDDKIRIKVLRGGHIVELSGTVLP